MVCAAQLLSRRNQHVRRLVDCATGAENRFYKGEHTMCGVKPEGGGNSKSDGGKSSFEGIRSTEENGASSVASEIWKRPTAKDCGSRINVDVDVNVDIDVNNINLNRDGRPFGRGLNNPHIQWVKNEVSNAAHGFGAAFDSLRQHDPKDRHHEPDVQFEGRMGGAVGEDQESAVAETSGKMGKWIDKNPEGEWKDAHASELAKELDFSASTVENGANALDGFRTAAERLEKREPKYLDLGHSAEGFHNANARA
jgi:hypothetical protein